MPWIISQINVGILENLGHKYSEYILTVIVNMYMCSQSNKISLYLCLFPVVEENYREEDKNLVIHRKAFFEKVSNIC